jgi:hypothetical protein
MRLQGLPLRHAFESSYGHMHVLRLSPCMRTKSLNFSLHPLAHSRLVFIRADWFWTLLTVLSGM